MNAFNEFMGLYPLSKTLRFELKPIGQTLQFIMSKGGILEQDERLANSYAQVKEIIDEYHKAFIERRLAGFELKYDSEDKKDSLQEYFMYYNMKYKEERDKNTFKQIQGNLRKQIAERLSKDEAFQRIDKKELIQQDLISFVETQPNCGDKRALIEKFRNFTTYFSGFHENRKNMYSAEEQSTSIAYRLINENLPKFIDNVQAFSKVMGTEVSEKMPQLYEGFQEYLNVENIEEMFQLKYFSTVLTQKQIDVYNAIIGGRTLDDNVKIKGLNEYINLYNQQHKDAKLPKLKLLFKQILSDRNAVSWLPEEFDSDGQVLAAIKKCYESLSEHILGNTSLKLMLESLGDFDLNGIFISNDLQLTDISQKIFGNWGIIQKALQAKIANDLPQKRKESFDDYQERIAKRFKSFDSFSIEYIKECLSAVEVPSGGIEKYFSDLGAVDNETEQKENHFACIANAYEEVRDLLNNPYPTEKRLSQDETCIEKIKQLLDEIKALQHFVKPLLGMGNEPNKDERFYGEFTALWNELDQITPLYNMVRNYVTRKPYSEKKIKLNFENGNLLGGWVDSKTENSDNGTQYGGYLFRKRNDINEYDYYLGISSDKKLFRNRCNEIESSKKHFERLNYYQLKSQSIYGSSYKGDYSDDKKEMISIIEQIIEQSSNNDLKIKIENEREKKQSKVDTPAGYLNFIKANDYTVYINLLRNDNFLKKNVELIETAKETLSSIIRIPKAQELSKRKYALFTEIMEDIENLCKEKVFEYFPICEEELTEAMNRKKKTLYLFKISNKDLSYADSFIAGKRKSRGIDNIHTMYFKALMDGNQNVLDIGTGEIFYREETKGLKKEPTHYANIAIKNKNECTKGRKETSLFPYDLIKNKRYTGNRFLFHISIIQNYMKEKGININPVVNECLRHADDVHIIGIDRGERHLLYLVVIDKKGNIKEQFSLNEIVNEYNGNRYSTDYHKLLNQREGERLKARQSWQNIESIKELKEGYLSQVIHKITELMVKYNAIVVLEDLNFGFMRGRQKVEKQVYQKFEKMLIDKLNYLVDKKKDPNEFGGILKAYQLTNKFESFQKLGKQSGFLFYIPAWNTSKIDPQTGFVNLLDVHYESVEKAKNFFCKFDSIRYNASKNWFEFVLDYDKFSQKAEGTNKHWTLCTYDTRIETFRNANKNSQWDSVEVNLTEKFKEHFNKYHIDIHANLKETISNQTEKVFFEGLLHLLKLTLQMRNSKVGTDIDYLISPVADEKGVFYDSRSCDSSLPANADANGAYNIARKGLWVLEQIKETSDLKKLKLAISNKEWLRFAQEKPYLND